MAIVSIGSATNNNSSGTATVVLPAGVQADDLIEVVLHINGPKTSSDGNGATPFTELLVDRAYNGPSAQVDHYYRIATGAEPGTLTFPLSASDRWVAICTVDRGVDTASPYDVSPTASSENTGTGATNTTNQLVTLTDGALMKSYAGNDSSTVTFGTLPSGWTTIANESGRQLVAMVSKSMPTAGTQSAISYEQDASNGTWLNNIYALKPAASGTTYNSAVVDSIGVVDSVSQISSYIRAKDESMGISDLISKVAAHNRSVTDSLTISDAVSYQLVISVSLVDSIGLADNTNRTHIGIYNISDPIGLVDSSNRVVSANRNLNDIQGIADQVSRTLSYIYNVSDAIGLSDTISRQLISFRNLTEGMGVADVNDETETTVEYEPVVQTYLGALYLGLYSPTAGEVTITELPLVDSVTISDTITALIGTSLGYNPDITLDGIVDIKLSVVAVDDTKGEVESIFEQKLQTKISDIKGGIEGIEDFKPSVESV